jgi:hypothetical protein
VPDDPIPLRDAAEEFGYSTTMVRRAWRDDVLELVQTDRGLAIELAELERVKRECRCKEPGCDTGRDGQPGLTLGKTRLCEPHRGKANRGKSVAAGTRKKQEGYRISKEERDRRVSRMSEANKRRGKDQREAAIKHRQATRRERIDGAKDEAGEVVFDVGELGARVGRSATTVTEHIRQGLAQPDVPRPKVSGRHPYLLSGDAAEAYERQLANHEDGRMQRFAGRSDDRRGQRIAEEFYARWCQESGRLGSDLPLEAAMAIVRPFIRARRSVYRFKAGARSANKEELHAGWRRRFYKKRRELTGWSDFQVCVSVADDHIRESPTDWPKYEQHPGGGLRPEDERRAAQRVWYAIQ